MIKKVPNFMIIGAAKSGTSSLAYYLSQNNKIWIPEEKETHFFSSDEIYETGLTSYIKSFYEGVSEELAIGDATPAYLSNYKKVIPRIKRDLGADLRFIVVLRNPVDRAFSHYLHQCRNRKESLGLLEAVSLELTRLEKEPEGWRQYFHDGLYSAQLEAWFQEFGEEKFQIMTQEDLLEQPGKKLNELFEFLGVPKVHIKEMSKRNTQAIPRYSWVMRFLASEFPGKVILKNIFPPIQRRRFIVGLRRWNLKKVDQADRREMTPKEREYLTHLYKDEVENLESLLGRDLSHWKGAGHSSSLLY